MSKQRGAFGPGGMPGGGGAKNQAALLRQIQKMQEDMEAAQAALEDETLDVSVGGGAVSIVITGSQSVKSVTINSELIDTEDEEWLTDLQDLLVLGINQAIEQSKQHAADRMEGATGSLGNMLPGGLGGLLG
ncbi:YbaB/EbfC family nucleoid-associated protein [Aggregatilinea lenta]|uniref:YbaB/EbfC family nucleoid-associated protein n=1 Tax=Aggregatilinea lenta TaxID=913108 RepID=UPI001EE803E5|nr:YbaB/EbfC family nucleoid-associated protein [Aggregatilinea lenta]